MATVPPAPPTTLTVAPTVAPTPTPAAIGTTVTTTVPIQATGITKVNYRPLPFNLSERSEADFNSILATSSKMAR